VWGLPTARLAEQMIDMGLQARLSCIDTRVLDRRFAGRLFDRSLLTDLPSHIDPCGENGEFHTCVSAGPMFTDPLDLEAGDTVTREPFMWTDFELRRT
jgi:diphthamide synthase (EF-2-diphthine--ammonia ligase)